MTGAVDIPLLKDLQDILNKHCVENDSNTPDYILAQFLLGCLASFNVAVIFRDKWYDIEPKPGWNGGKGNAV